MADLWNRLGVNWDGVKAGANADFWSANRDFSPAGWEHLQGALDRTYDDFLGKVAEGRGLDRAAVHGAAKGQVWSGADAKDRGLVDALGGYRAARSLAREAAGIAADAPVRIREFPKRRDPFEILIEDALAGELEGSGVRALARGLARFAAVLGPLAETIESVTGDPRALSLRAPELRPAD